MVLKIVKATGINRTGGTVKSSTTKPKTTKSSSSSVVVISPEIIDQERSAFEKRLKNATDSAIASITTVGNAILEKIRLAGEKLMATMAVLEASVAKSTEVQQSAIVLIQGLAQQLRDAGTDPVKLQELADALDINAASLADAVAANTPAAKGGGPKV